jgi:ribonuclease H2 subunit A
MAVDVPIENPPTDEVQGAQGGVQGDADGDAQGDARGDAQGDARGSDAALVLPTATGFVSSAIPEGCTRGEVKLGIDEAGRGAVLGPMTYGCAFWPLEIDAEISALGFDDSKALKEEQRAALFARMRDEARVGWEVKMISSAEIARSMLRPDAPVSLNAISHDAAAELVRRAIDAGVRVAEVYVDTVGEPQSYKRKLERQFPSIRFTVEEKADAKFKTVSAASIAAKVLRDRALVEWRWEEPAWGGAPSARAAAGKAAAPAAPDCEFGTGYPGGPGTKDWLERNLQPVFGWPSIVRFSWSTAREMLGDVEGGGNAALAGAARFTWAADADAESGALGGVPKLSDYFFSKPADGGESKRATDEAAPAAKRLRHQYFRDRKLEIVTSVF